MFVLNRLVTVVTVVTVVTIVTIVTVMTVSCSSRNIVTCVICVTPCFSKVDSTRVMIPARPVMDPVVLLQAGYRGVQLPGKDIGPGLRIKVILQYLYKLGRCAVPLMAAFAERYASCMIGSTGLSGEGGNIGMPITVTFGGIRTFGTAGKDASTGAISFTPALRQ